MVRYDIYDTGNYNTRGDVLEGKPVPEGAHTGEERFLLVPDAHVASDTGELGVAEKKGHKVGDGCKGSDVSCARERGSEDDIPFLLTRVSLSVVSIASLVPRTYAPTTKAVNIA